MCIAIFLYFVHLLISPAGFAFLLLLYVSNSSSDVQKSKGETRKGKQKRENEFRQVEN